MPDDIVNITYALSEDYMMTRYPDVTDKLPFQSYNEQMASQKISQSEKLLLWVKNKLGE